MIVIRSRYTAFLLRLYRRLVSSSTSIIYKRDTTLDKYNSESAHRYKFDIWERNGMFMPQNGKESSLSMVLPPPNVTGTLHLGHALTCTLQDVIVRRKRSQGYNVLWLPGIDHAGIATQNVVEKYLKTTNLKYKNRYDMGREIFNNEIWKWTETHGDTIKNQLRKLGCSLDWSRQKFTMDQRYTDAVNTAFITLFKKGYIYRKKALVNWCNALKSTVSDIEVDNVFINGPTDIKVQGYDKPVKFGLLYNFIYKVFNSDRDIVVSTTMPETMLGDSAIAVHPRDERYRDLIGMRAFHPFKNRTIPIIYDEFVDMKFGTGAVKITPAHSKVDYDVAVAHNLPLIQVIDEQGCMHDVDEFTGMKRYDCREAIIKKLEDKGLMIDVVSHQINLPVCSRTGDVISHLPKEQWFVSCSELNQRASQLVQSGKLKIEPEKFVKNWQAWTEGDRDWCISRQLWWGHQIPAFKCTCGPNTVWIPETDISVARLEASKYLRTMPETINIERDTDVLDTWFSSGIYPFAVFGWPENTVDFRDFYPLSLMVTGHDILGFWVHRMIILGMELTNRLPFKKVLLHGIICDNKGAKMSKSKGNVIDPMDIMNGITMAKLKEKSVLMHKNGILSKQELEKALDYHRSNFSNTNGIPPCGPDALRFTLLSHDIKSQFVNFDISMCHANKLFCNKIWQSYKYTHLSYAKLKLSNDEVTVDDLSSFDKWILSKLAKMVKVVNEAMDEDNYHLATKAIRTFMYNEFCDIYIESTKPGFSEDNLKIGYAHAHVLSAALNTALRCLSPFMVYLTDELIPLVPAFENNIIHNFNDTQNPYFEFPKYNDFKVWENVPLEKQLEKVLDTVFLTRELKGIYGISNKLRPAMYVHTTDEMLKSNIISLQTVVLLLARCGNIQFDYSNTCQENTYVKGILDKETEVCIEIKGDDADVTISAGQEKLLKRIQKMKKDINKLETQLSNNKYLQSTPHWTQVIDREKLLTRKEELEHLETMIKRRGDQRF